MIDNIYTVYRSIIDISDTLEVWPKFGNAIYR